MKRRAGASEPRPSRSSADLSAWLGVEPSGRDFVPGVMGRLGFMHAHPRVVRRRLWARRALRAASGLALVSIVVGGVLASGLLPSARRPSGPTMPAAIGAEVERHQDQFQGMIRTIRSMTPAPPLDEDVDRSAVGPFRWL